MNTINMLIVKQGMNYNFVKTSVSEFVTFYKHIKRHVHPSTNATIVSFPISRNFYAPLSLDKAITWLL